MSTLRDVARTAGVSLRTLSAVIDRSPNADPETRAHVERVMVELGFVARASRSRKTGARPLLSVRTRKQSLIEAAMPPRDTARTILRIVRATQPISRVDLARQLKVHRSTVTEIVTPLIDSGILREAAPEEALHRRGRPPVGLRLGGERQFVIGVNIGVRRTQVGAATTTGRMLDEETFDTPPDSGAALAQIGAIVGRLRSALPKRSLVAIGVSVPGPTDAGRSKLLFAPHLGWRDVAIADALLAAASESKHPGNRTPVIVANDATAAATYEARRRLRSGQAAQDDFILVRAGTGIGVGLVLGGEVYQGSGADRGLLGEFGHMTIVAGGEQCACGNRGCWEVYASAAAAIANYADGAPLGEGAMRPRFTELVERARAGELRARTTLGRIGANLGIGISNVITGLGVSRVVVSGRVVHGWEFLRASLEEAVAHSMAGRLSHWSIEAGEPTGAGLGGAVEVAIEHYLTQLAHSARAA